MRIRATRSVSLRLRSPLVGASDEALLRLRALRESKQKTLDSLVRLDADAALFRASDAPVCSGFAIDCNPGAFAGVCNLRSPAARANRRLRLPTTPISISSRAGAPGCRKHVLDAFVEELSIVRDSNPREPDARPKIPRTL